MERNQRLNYNSLLLPTSDAQFVDPKIMGLIHRNTHTLVKSAAKCVNNLYLYNGTHFVRTLWKAALFWWEAVQMRAHTHKPIINSSHKVTPSHFLKHFIRGVHKVSFTGEHCDFL